MLTAVRMFFPLLRPLFAALDPERAHAVTIDALRLINTPAARADEDRRLRVHALGLDFPNPFGLAAGFDKNAQVTEAMLRMGFGFVEAGTVTPRPQVGNPKPRIFRLTEDRAVINRLGFNNQGIAAARVRLQRLQDKPGIRGINIGANKDAADRVADYIQGLKELGPLASYVTVNISSPNTPGLRGLQNRAELETLLGALIVERNKLAKRVPLLVKIAPDLDEDGLRAIAEVALAHKIEGLIISNTTIARPATLKSTRARETGGLSGAPLFAPSTEVLRTMRKLTDGRLVLIGVGGISSAANAYAKIRAGASLVQLYTALTFDGPALVETMKQDLLRLLERDGLATISDAIGRDGR